MSNILPNKILDALRFVGDPDVDPNRNAIAAKVGAGPNRMTLQALASDEDLVAFSSSVGIDGGFGQTTMSPAPELVEGACHTFSRYGSEIGAALLLAGLPEAYAARRGAHFLVKGSPLAKGGLPRTERIAATAQFVIAVLTPDTPASVGTTDPNVNARTGDREYKYKPPDYLIADQLWGQQGQARCYTVALRILHASIRDLIHQANRGDPTAEDAGKPLNQEDLLAMLLTFTITVFDVLEQFGIHLTPEQQYCYFAVWDYVGKHLGIGDESVILAAMNARNRTDAYRLLHDAEGPPTATQAAANKARGRSPLLADAECRHVLKQSLRTGSLRPTTVAEGRALLERLRDRLWVLEEDVDDATHPPFNYMEFNQILADVQPGRILLRALLEEIMNVLPARQKTWPASLMRQILPPQVRNRLALGAPSVPDAFDVTNPAFTLLRRSGVDQLPAAVLRWRATKVADDLFLSYIEKGSMGIPGLEADMLGVEA